MKEVPAAGLYEKFLVAMKFRDIYRIEGDSMFPALNNGEEVIVEENAAIGVGDIVIARHPFRSSVVMAKRITAIDANGKYFLVGDNADASDDSRKFGPVSKQMILGKVVARL